MSSTANTNAFFVPSLRRDKIQLHCKCTVRLPIPPKINIQIFHIQATETEPSARFYRERSKYKFWNSIFSILHIHSKEKMGKNTLVN